MPAVPGHVYSDKMRTVCLWMPSTIFRRSDRFERPPSRASECLVDTFPSHLSPNRPLAPSRPHPHPVAELHGPPIHLS